MKKSPWNTWQALLLASLSFAGYSAEAASISNLQASSTDSQLTFQFNYSQSSGFYQIFIDSDQKANTGYKFSSMGADYVIENGSVMKYTGSGYNWSWSRTGSATFSASGGVAQFTVNRSLVGMTASCSAVSNSYIVARVGAASGTTVAVSSQAATSFAMASSCTAVGSNSSSGNRSPANTTDATTPTTSPSSSGSASSTSIASQIAADMGKSEGKAHGIESWGQSISAWSGIVGGLRQEHALPSGWTSGAAWGQFYRDTTNASDSNTRIAVKNFVCYMFNKNTLQWELLANTSIGGDAYVENFSTNSSISIDKRMESDGSLSVKLVKGYNFHFWPNARLKIDASKHTAFYVVYSARKVVDDSTKTDDRSIAKYLMNIGGDWWASQTAGYSGFNGNNTEIGYSKMKYLTNDWQTIRFSSMPDADLVNYPPPQ